MVRNDFVALIPVGPGEIELQRVRDLLDSLFCYERPDKTGLVLINDGNSVPRLEALLNTYRLCAAKVVPNPRKGRGEAWTDGLTTGILAGLHWIASNLRRSDFVLKLDSDSLIIDSFSNKIRVFFSTHSEIGVVGTCFNEPGGGDPTNTIHAWTHRVKKLQRPFAVWRSENIWHPQIGLFGRSRRIRHILAAALTNGYRYGESCIGGAYALSWVALQCIYRHGLLNDPRLFLHRHITEDVIMGLLTRSIGLKLADFNRRDEPFGVRWRGLCGPPEELLQSGYSIIHSVKDSSEHQEQEIRAFFAERRSSRRGADAS
jgi:hypothetical protein